MEKTAEQKKIAILSITEKCLNDEFRFDISSNNRLSFNKSRLPSFDKQLAILGSVDGFFTPNIPTISSLTVVKHNNLKVRHLSLLLSSPPLSHFFLLSKTVGMGTLSFGNPYYVF